MSGFNFEHSDKEFYRGKRLLDSGRYRESIDVYNKLIAYASKYDNEADTILTLETSYNNLGIALCKVGLLTKDKNMYLEGMENFKKSIAFEKDETQNSWLTAYKNLKSSEKVMETFDASNNSEGDFFQSI